VFQIAGNILDNLMIWLVLYIFSSVFLL
jgi:hypothetical protein